MLKACFIADGGPQRGMGHVQQATTLAKALRGSAEISFLTQSDEVILAKIQEAGFAAVRLPDEPAIFRHLRELAPDVVIFDKIDVDAPLARAIKHELRLGLVIFTNLSAANQYADMAVTADIGSNFKNVRYIDEATGTLTFFGPKYWVLRPEFYEFKQRGKPRTSHVRRVLIMFGGSDPANLTSAAVAELLAMAEPPQVDIVLGASFPHDRALAEILDQHSALQHLVTVHRNTTQVAALMYHADLVLASPGLSAFEALCVGTPVIIMPQNALQRDTYQGSMQMIEREESGQLPAMIERGEFTYPEDEHIVAMQIGEGVNELVTEILRVGRAA